MARPSDIAEQKVSQLSDHPRFPGKPLETSGGGGDSTGMDVVDAKIAAAEARTQTALVGAMGEMRTEFAALRGDIRELKASTASKGTVFATGITLFLGIAALLAAFLAYGNDMFGSGLNSSQIAQAAAERALEKQATQAQAAPPKS